MPRKVYDYEGKSFTIDPISPSVVKVTYKDQTGYMGLNLEWDAYKPYGHTTHKSNVISDRVKCLLGDRTPEEALEYLCRSLLVDQRKEDSQRINPKERQEAAMKVLGDFLSELPDEIVQ